MKNHEFLSKDEPLPLPSSHHLGHKFLKLWGENHESDQAIVEFGTASFNKGILIDEPRRENEDAIYCNLESAVFGIFDGEDNTNHTMKASKIAATVARESVEDAAPENTDDMAEMIESINDAIYYDQTSGHSTGTIGRVIIKNGKKFLLYASIGDSRIYLIRDGDAHQITTDENKDHHNPNSLGKSMVSIRQIGEIPLKKTIGSSSVQMASLIILTKILNLAKNLLASSRIIHLLPTLLTHSSKNPPSKTTAPPSSLKSKKTPTGGAKLAWLGRIRQALTI